MKKIWVVVIVVVCAGVFFYIGMVYGKNTAQSSAGGRGTFVLSSSTRGFAGRFGSGAGGTGTTGQIISIGNGSLTVQLPNGNSQVVFYSSSTMIVEPTQVPASALKSGSQVVVAGTSNSDGSMTAQTIQVRPAGAGGFGGGPGGSQGSGNTGTSGANASGQ